MRILFVTRKYPPSTGGMENVAYELYTAWSAHPDNQVTLVKWGGSNKMLPVIYPWLFVRALIAGLNRKPDVIYLQDGMMAPLGLLLRLCVRRPTLMTIHGKEVTFENALYRAIVLPCIKRQNLLVAVSSDTERTLSQLFSEAHTALIPNGVSDSYYAPGKRTEQYKTLASVVDMNARELQKRQLILTVGRLERRKGVLWFIENVLPELSRANSSILYLVSGDGKDREVIEAAITERNMQAYVKMLGRTSDEVKIVLYNIADIFVMPNIPVVHDMEGFGLVALEAASCGTLVVAADLEGIPDAIKDGKNGVLVEAGNGVAFAQRLRRELRQRSVSSEAARNYTLAHYAWTKRAHEYEQAMQKLVR